jgi:hypothetical protein
MRFWGDLVSTAATIELGFYYDDDNATFSPTNIGGVSLTNFGVVGLFCLELRVQVVSATKARYSYTFIGNDRAIAGGTYGTEVDWTIGSNTKEIRPGVVRTSGSGGQLDISMVEVEVC